MNDDMHYDPINVKVKVTSPSKLVTFNLAETSLVSCEESTVSPVRGEFILELFFVTKGVFSFLVCRQIIR